MSFEPERWRIGLLFHRCYLKTRRAVDQQVRPLNLRHMWVMFCALEYKCSQQDMSQILDINENVLVRLVDHLEGLGFVKRETGREDARLRIVKITPAGHEQFKESCRLSVAAYNILLSKFSEKECDDLVRLLNKFLVT
jgi:DNA-binding MarR family transcriptional regulator